MGHCVAFGYVNGAIAKTGLPGLRTKELILGEHGILGSRR